MLPCHALHGTALPSLPGTRCGLSPIHPPWLMLINTPFVGVLPFLATPVGFRDPVLPGIGSQVNYLLPMHASWPGLGEPMSAKWSKNNCVYGN